MLAGLCDFPGIDQHHVLKTVHASNKVSKNFNLGPNLLVNIELHFIGVVDQFVNILFHNFGVFGELQTAS